jgi:hypothetical protein
MTWIIWISVMVAMAVAVWLAAPHHQRMIGKRDIEAGRD